MVAKVLGTDQIRSNLPAVTSQTIPLLAATANFDPNPAKGGDDTTIVGGALLPDVGPVGTIADVADHHTNDQISVYAVHEGDSLSQIAKMFGVSANTIIWANDLPKSGAIKPGQILTILPISGISHTVAKGETISSIAKKYKGDAEEIASFNGLEIDSKLAIGQKIIVPDGEISAPTSSSGGKPSSGYSGPSYAGYYLKPVPNGRRSQGLHGHNGIDFAAPVGSSVVAAADGVVIISKEGGWNGGYGNYVVIRHPNGTQTLYAHNTTNLVYPGQTVKQGQAIATVGVTGKVTGSHLHFEVRGAKNPF